MDAQHLLVSLAAATPERGAASPGTALAFAALTGLGLLAGAVAVRHFERWAIHHTGEIIAFAAGLLVSGALLHLLDRSIELVGVGPALVWTLLGFLLLYLTEAHFIPHVHARGESFGIEANAPERPPSHAQVGPLVVAGLTVHSVADGLSVGVALSAGAVIGSVAVLPVVAHKLPVGIAAMGALYHSGVSGRRASMITLALAAVTPTVVLLSYFVLRGVSAGVLGVLLALAGGTFLYVGAADLLPEGQARGRPVNTVLFFLGTAAMAALKVWVP